MIKKFLSHAKRVSYHLGRSIQLGERSFRVPGYYASRFETSVTRHEAYMVEVLRRRLEARPGTFVDVGVNIGQTLLKILSIDPARSYIGFEPQISCCYNLNQFIRLNSLHNASVLPLALFDSNQVLKFYARNQYDEMASLIATSNTSAAISYVQSRVGDEILGELGVEKISTIKIDVEGAELQVLNGLQETLRNERPPVVFEVLPNFFGVTERIRHPPPECVRNQTSADAIYELFESLDYEVHQIDENARETRIHRFELDDMNAYLGHNFIACSRN